MEYSIQRFDVEVFFVVAKATLKACFNVASCVADATENKGFTTLAAANMHFDSLAG
jgi:hypothetical protein